MLNDNQLNKLEKELRKDPRGYGWPKMLRQDDIESITTLINRNPEKGHPESIMEVDKILKLIPFKELLKIKNDRTFWGKKAKQGKIFFDALRITGNNSNLVDITENYFRENVEYCRNARLISKKTAIAITYSGDVPKRKKNKDRCRAKDLGIFPVDGTDILRIVNG